MTINQHNEEIKKNLQYWKTKPVLRQIYKAFYKLIAEHLANLPNGHVVELGSGIGNIKHIIPNCIRTDLFPNQWIDHVENAYRLSFSNNSVSDLILFDVFHHLRYPGTALKEFQRVLLPNGRVIIFDPCVSSMLGFIVFGLFHHEPLGMTEPIQWFAPSEWNPDIVHYYAAQANASRIFFNKEVENRLPQWKMKTKRRLSAISYVFSGGYSKPQLYPNVAFPMMRVLDRICDGMSALFATRLLVVLEKKNSGEQGA
jgi:SAM-dependent methyltransferase